MNVADNIVKVHVTRSSPTVDHKKFTIDLTVTSFQSVQSLIAKAFSISGDVHLYSRHTNRKSEIITTPLLSEWDFLAAIKSARLTNSVLELEVRPFQDILADWDVIDTAAGGIPKSYSVDTALLSKTDTPPLPPSSLLQSFGKRLSRIGFSLFGSTSTTDTDAAPSSSISQTTLDSDARRKKSKKPMCDTEFRSFLDSNGCLVRSRDFRLAVFKGGVEPSLRPVVWRHLLNVYPPGLTGSDRISHSKDLADVYSRLKVSWQRRLKSRCVPDRLRLVTSMVRKDVLRTDRTLPFFAHRRGSTDDADEANDNVLSLFNLLTTYALAHPSIGYCQGMSDLASPLLVVLKSEADAYVCFCALMRRLRRNFVCNGKSITTKFRHLSECLQFYDAAFYEYLHEAHADDLLFCYRWLLLELKREFAFDDALLMLETCWAATFSPTDEELSLFEIDISLLCCESDDFLCSGAIPSAPITARRSSSGGADGGDCCPCTGAVVCHCAAEKADAVEQPAFVKEDATLPPRASCFSCPENLCCVAQLEERKAPPPAPVCPAALLRSLALSSRKDDEEDGEERVRNDSGDDGAAWTFHAGDALSIMASRGTKKPTFLIGSGNDAFQWTANKVKRDDEEATCCSVPAELCTTRWQPEKVKVDPAVPQGDDEQTDEWCVVRDSPEAPSDIDEVKCRSKPEAVPSAGAIPLGIDAWLNDQPVEPNCELRLCEVEEIVREQHSCCASAPSRSRHYSMKSGASSGVHDASECCCCRLRSECVCDATKMRHSSTRSAFLTTVGAPSVAPPDSGFYSHLLTPRSVSTDFSSDATSQHYWPPLDFDRASPAPVDDVCSTPVVGDAGLPSAKLPTTALADGLFLPPPDELGDGAAFMIFLCTALLLQHREQIIREQMDYNEIAMYFDRHVRRNDVKKLLRAARSLFRRYLRMFHEAAMVPAMSFWSIFLE